MAESSVSRIGLGTAQFGLVYGVANRGGQVGIEEAAAILSEARARGIDTLDTAATYGESESRLGGIGVAGWRIITKVPAVPGNVTDAGAWVRDSIAASLRRLRIARCDGVLLHRSRDLTMPYGDAVRSALDDAKARGIVGKIGVSIYDPEELDALTSQLPLDLIQAPLNVLDRRLVTSGWLDKLTREGTEVHTRSAFLQGLLLMGYSERPRSFEHWRPLLDRWHRWLEERALSPVCGALGYVLGLPQISRVVIGIDSVLQLSEVLAAAAAPPVSPPSDLVSDDPDLINPSHWAAS